MSGNSVLNKARYSENTDEWYTDYKVVEKELIHYKEQFYDKIVLCNCDDPFESAFSKYFLKNFNSLGLKKLICTSYSASKMHEEANSNGPMIIDFTYALVVKEIPHSNREILDDEVIATFLKNGENIVKLHGDGDFRSEECVDYLKEADIIVTNPPFSKFTDIFSLITKYKKKYLLISNQNAITYKVVFPFIKNNLARVGYHFGDMAFKVPKDTKPRKTRFWIDETGQKWRSIGNAMWLTNLEVIQKNKELKLSLTYDPSRYTKYDNYDAIHIKKVVEIPSDYNGIMGVPITYLKYHNEEQYEIIGEANHGSDNEFDLFKPKINGKDTFKRILIKKRRSR